MRIPAPNYTQTPNDLFDHWLPHLGEAELKVLLVIMRKTLGWHKVRDRISISQLTSITGLLRETVIKAAKSLQERGIINREVVGENGTQMTFYELIIHEDSNSSDQSVKPTRPVGLNQPVSTDPQKKPSYTKETTTKESAPSAPAAVSFEKNPQQPPPPNLKPEKPYDCLTSVDIPLCDKLEVTRKYPEDVVKHAVAFATHPVTTPKIKTTLAQTLKWACQKNPEIPTNPEDEIEENKKYAKLFENTKKMPQGIYYEALNERILFSFDAQKDPIPLKYSEKGFKTLLDEQLKKFGVL